jgi:hypothetical protein
VPVAQGEEANSANAAAALLLRELLRWVAARPRSYSETMEAWRTSCPRSPVWEDATRDGLVEVLPGARLALRAVRLTERGRALLADGEKGLRAT